MRNILCESSGSERVRESERARKKSSKRGSMVKEVQGGSEGEGGEVQEREKQ